MNHFPILRQLVRFVGVNALLSLSLSWASASETYVIKSCKVSFETTGSPVLVKIIGSSKKPCVGNVEVDGSVIKSSQITMELDEIDTGIGLRNKHLRENYLHVDKFPVATVKLAEAKDLAVQIAGNVKKTAVYSGTLNLHGKEAPLNKTEYNFTAPKKLTAKFSINLNDHGVDYPSFMGVKVVDVVHVTVALEL